jgi:phosphoserine phosphatase RsbU/P
MLGSPTRQLSVQETAALERARTPLAELAHTPARAVSRVLVISDDPRLRPLLRLYLQKRKYVVDYAPEGSGAIARLHESEPDLVVLDVPTLVPGCLDTLKLIKTEHLDTAVIVTTADRSEDLAIEALRLGADNYLRKPFKSDEFDAQLDRVIERLMASRENAAQHRQLGMQLARAAQIQAELLPRECPPIAGFELSACCMPAQWVGGDFYDWQQIAPNLLKLTVGDVMGKGMPAALLMASVRTVLRSVASDSDPVEAVQSMAATLDDDLGRSGAFVTLFHAQIDTATSQMTFVDAGHGYALLRRADGTVQSLTPWSLPLGIVSDERYQGGSVALDPGDVLVVYTDGLKEARPDLWPTREALATHVAGNMSAACIVEGLLNKAKAAGPLTDDITVVVLRRV